MIIRKFFYNWFELTFNPLEFEGVKNESGNNYFVLSPQKWVESTNAKGIVSKSGRYGGTFAHTDKIHDESLFKFLLSKVGSDWDQIYAEAKGRLNDPAPYDGLVKIP